MAAPPPPQLNIPASTATVSVSIINTSGCIRGVPTASFMTPANDSNPWLNTPCFGFLVQHPTLNRAFVFDLGIRKDVENLPSPTWQRLKGAGYTFIIPSDVREILDQNNFDISTLEAVVWSHYHFDHTGDPQRFPKSTKLVVGPGFKEKLAPGWPVHPHLPFSEKDYEGHELHELDFDKAGLMIGKLQALDYFGDGSFYFLNTPGHAIGHICGFARVTSDPPSFVLMGGDAVHHGGEMRPSTWLPLPESISPHPCMEAFNTAVCPGAIFEDLLPEGRDKPFYKPHGMVHFDIPEMIRSIEKLQEADAHDNVLVLPGHEHSILNVLDFYPKNINDFAKKGWARALRWKFLQDFAKGRYDGEVVGVGDYSPLPKKE